MACLALAGRSGAADATAFPSAYSKIARNGPLAEGLPVLAHGRVSREDGARPTLILGDLQPRDTASARLSALTAPVPCRLEL